MAVLAPGRHCQHTRGLWCHTPWMPDQIFSQVIPARLVALRGHVDQLLSEDQCRSYVEFIEAGEWRLALEMLADWLAEESTPIPSAARAEMIELSHDMDIVERVSTTLSECPNSGL